MDFAQIYHFIFETYAGIGILVGAGLIVTLILAIVLEKKTRRIYKNIEKPKNSWSLFGDDEEDEENGAEKDA